MTQLQITGTTGTVDGSGSLTTYKVPGAVLVTPYSVSATANGTGAGGAFLPCLTFRSATGAIIARCPAPGVVAGDTAEVSWFPHVADSTGDIKYDVDNVGDWLDVVTTGSEPGGGGNPSGIALLTKNEGWFFIETEGTGSIGIQSDGGDLDIEADGRVQIRSDGDSPNGDAGIVIDAMGTDGDLLLAVESSGSLILSNTGGGGYVIDPTGLPNADPHSVGVLFLTGTALQVSLG